jgi:hypothetical protein
LTAAAITLQFDYRYDTAGFFGTQQSPTPARTALELAGRAFESFSDSLAAIEPVGANQWTAQFANPSSGALATIANLAVPANEIIVFPGAYDLADSRLGEAEPGTSQLAGAPTASFVQAVVNRGQGSAAEDFAPWGGTISFDTLDPLVAPRAWHFDPNSPPTGGAFDFYSTAVHELSHLLGFGSSAAFLLQQFDDAFTGPNSVALYGGPVPLQTSGVHWAAGVASPPFAATTMPAMGSTLPAEVRRLMTPLDYAGLADVGWNVPPELVGLTGDANADGAVDGADVLAWQLVMGSPSAATGDVTGDGAADQFDVWIIGQRYGASAATPAKSAAATVPEPLGALPALWGLAWMRRRLRSREGELT